MTNKEKKAFAKENGLFLCDRCDTMMGYVKLKIDEYVFCIMCAGKIQEEIEMENMAEEIGAVKNE